MIATSMDQLYLIHLFYPTLAQVAKEVREFSKEAQAMSKGNYRVLASGAGTCCIGFVSDLDYATIGARLRTIHADDFNWLIMPATSQVRGWMSGGSWDWIAARLPRD